MIWLGRGGGGQVFQEWHFLEFYVQLNKHDEARCNSVTAFALLLGESIIPGI